MNQDDAVWIQSATGTDNPLYPDAFSIRRTVFGGEQQVPVARDRDGLDPVCRHFVLFVGDEPAAALRVLPHGDSRRSEGSGDSKNSEDSKDSAHPLTWQVERVATLTRFRGRGYGRMLVERVLEEARRLGIREVTLHSQVQAVGFYEKLGFEAYGPEFEDAGIRHRCMRAAVK